MTLWHQLYEQILAIEHHCGLNPRGERVKRYIELRIGRELAKHMRRAG